MTTSKKSKILVVLSLLIALIAVAALALVVWKYYEEKRAPEPEVPDVESVGPEVGTYYYDANIQEYTLTLNEGHTFALFIKGETLFGTYTLTGDVLVLDFSIEGKKNLEARLADNVITMTYDGAGYRLLKKVTYSVSFQTNGGSAIAAQPVMNGKLAKKPSDPIRVRYVFVGWYADAEFKAPYDFGAQAVTSDMTLYARWSLAVEGSEHEVELNANYEGASSLAAVKTFGGKLFDLPTPAREGYTFGGWWLSAADRGDKLTCRYQGDMVVGADTTLYALWLEDAADTKLTPPLVSVNATTVTWDAVSGASSYDVTVLSATGVTVFSESTTTTVLSVPFAEYAEGEYEIRVRANAISGEADHAESVRYYTNKALERVTGLQVIDTMLIFRTVQNAERYLITVNCGNDEHQHTAFDNGSSATFHFANCEMQKGGITFTVTAVAKGYAASVSKTLIYEKALSAAEGFSYDAKTQTVLWKEVANAHHYMVSVTCGNAAHDPHFVNNGSKAFVSVAGCDALEGGILVKVYPVAKGYNSPEAVEYKAVKDTLATPADIRLNGTLLSWTAVNGAQGYEVKVGETVYETVEGTFDLSAILSGVQGSTYTVRVRAIGDSESLWSDALVAADRAMSGKLSYVAGMLYWNPVIGAASYELQVNDGEIVVVSGACFAPIVLTRAGTNVLKVRFVDGNDRCEWVTTEVYAHAVILDARAGNAVPVQYKAVGDRITLPTTEKEGYVFKAWYNVPGGAACNGKRYADEFFAESGGIVLYAYYTPVKYTLDYNCGEGGSSTESSAEVFFEQNYRLAVPTANSATSVFGGWFTAPYGAGTQLTDAKGNSLAPWSLTEGAEIYAFWIDAALEFTPIQLNGKDGYAVSAGEGSAQLFEITIPATYNDLPVLMVADNAFKDRISLAVIDLPATLELISDTDPFGGCLSLEAVNVYGDTRDTSARYWSWDGVLFDNGTDAQAQPRLLLVPLAKTGAYRIPDGVSEIPEGAFAGCALSRVMIPTGVTMIGTGAFANAAKLTAVIFEHGESAQPLTILAKAFSGCTALERIALPARLADIVLTKYAVSDDTVDVADVDNAFAGCTALTSITVASGSTVYKAVDGVLYSADGKTLFYCPTTREGAFGIPSGTQTVFPGAFVGCNAITEVTLPDTIVLVGECAFYGLGDRLERVIFAEKAFQDAIVERYAFRGCAALAEVVFGFGSRVASLGEGAFYGCKALESLTLPTTMTFIGADAFRDCIALEMLTFAPNGKMLALGDRAFYGCASLTRVTLPANVADLACEGIFFGCASLESVTVLGNVVEIGKNTFRNCVMLSEILLPPTVKAIRENAFGGCERIVTFTLPAALETLEAAFIGSGLTEYRVAEGNVHYQAVDGVLFSADLTKLLYYPVNKAATVFTVPKDVSEIGSFAFAHVSALCEVIFEEGGSKKLTIREGAFVECTSLQVVKLPERLDVVEGSAFCRCPALGEIVVFATISYIGSYAFLDCEALTLLLREEAAPLAWSASWSGDCPVVYGRDGTESAE